MSTVADDFLERVRERMAALRATQGAVAKSCGLSQPHLSKVLSRRIKLAKKTSLALADWLTHDKPADEDDSAQELRQLVERLLEGPTERRMQIMQLLRILAGLTR
jgi:transcriptional regulator with XRE-family HTH domain